jgi:quercetin dioxygenase-like cupin family protein
MSDSPVRHFSTGFHWNGVDTLQYKSEGSAPFRGVTRQVLFSDADLACQLRYFEVQPQGYSTLERHQHMHAVMVVRGRGRCLVGDAVHELHTHDLITIPAMAWHQFRAEGQEPLGFLCMVNTERDRPQLPTEQDLKALQQDPAIAAFIAR